MNLSSPVLVVGSQLLVVAVLIMLAGQYPAPVMLFVAILWILFLIHRADNAAGANPTTFKIA